MQAFPVLADGTSRVFLTPQGLVAWDYTRVRDPKRIPAVFRAASATSSVAAGEAFAAVGNSGAAGYHLHYELYKGGTQRKSPATLLSYVQTPPFTITFDNLAKEKSFYLTDLFNFMSGAPREDRPKGLNLRIGWEKTAAHLDGIAVYMPGQEADIDYDGSWLEPSAASTGVRGPSTVIKPSAADCVSNSTYVFATDYICPRPWNYGGPAVTMFGIGTNLLFAASDRYELPVTVLGRANRVGQTAEELKLKFVQPLGRFSTTMVLSRGNAQVDAYCKLGTVTFNGTIQALLTGTSSPTLRVQFRESFFWPQPCPYFTDVQYSYDIPLTGPETQKVFSSDCPPGLCTTTHAFKFASIDKTAMTGQVVFTHRNTAGPRATGTAQIVP